MQRRDPRGHPVSTTSAAALDASERALWRMMSFYGAPLDDLDVAVSADPGWILPRLMKAGFLLSLTEPALVAEAAALLADAARLAPSANARERGHLVALQRLAAGDWAGASDAWTALLHDHPRDALALQWAHLFDFYRGDTVQLLAHVAGVLPAWPDDDPLLPCVLALHAFGLEESGRFDEAEAAGRRALAGSPRVPWAIHAVAHVMEMQGRHAEGRRWLGERRPHWGAHDGADRNGFAGHLAWHEALFALETLDTGAALASCDAYLGAARIEITLERVDAASLLWRLALLGVDVGDRWRALLAGWRLDVAVAGQSVFNDLHATLAMIGAGELAAARDWAALSLDEANRRTGWNHAISRDLGAPLQRAVLAFGAGDFGAAAEGVAPLRGRLAPLGGSRAQRDVVDQTLLAAASASGRATLARAVLDDRGKGKARTPLTAWWEERVATGCR